MYKLDEKFINLLRAPSQIELHGVVLTEDHAYILDDTTLSQGSVSITRGCSSTGNFEIGSVIASEFIFGLRLDASRYEFYDAHVECRATILAPDLDSVDVPLGVFTIIDVTRAKHSLTFVAYDNTIKLDKAYEGTTISGTPYDVMVFVANRCNIELGQEDYSDFTNSTSVIGFDTDSGLNTYRDLVGAVAQVMGCFVQCDRYGKLCMVKYVDTPVLHLTEGQRYSSEVEDYVCEYSTLSISNRDKTYLSYSKTKTNKLTYVYEDAPGFDYGIASEHQRMTDNLMAILDTVSYTPSTLSIPSDPTLDAGDLLEIEYEDTTLRTLITEIVWHYKSATSLKSEGDNPYFKAVSEPKGGSRRGGGADSTTQVRYYTYTNILSLQVFDEFKEISRVRFTTTQDAELITQCLIDMSCVVDDETRKMLVGGTEVIYTVPRSEEVTLRYNLDGEYLGEVYRDRVLNGYNLIPLLKHLNVSGGIRHELSIEAKIESGVGYLPIGSITGILSGQGLQSIETWDGVIELSDTFGVSLVRDMAINFNDNIDSITYDKIDEHTINDVFSIPLVGGLAINFKDEVIPHTYEKQYKRITEDGNYTRITEDGNYRGT